MNNNLSNKYFDLSDYSVFITGAAGYIGTQISLHMAELGAKVILNGRNLAKLKKLQKVLESKNLKSEISCFDINNNNQVKKFFKKNNIDILINNAAISLATSSDVIVKQDFEKVYKTNLVSVASLSEACCLNMIKRNNKKSKSIINISSIYGLLSADFRVYQKGQPKSSLAYASSKAALNQLTKNMAIKYAKNNIRINTVTPGIFPNPKYIKKYPSFFKKIKSKIPLNRVGSPEEIITSILFLCSPYSSYVTGTNIVVDGGYTIV